MLASDIEITGITDLPLAGDKFMAFETEKEARNISLERQTRSRSIDTNKAGMSLEDLFGQIKDGAKTISVVLKTDVISIYE